MLEAVYWRLCVGGCVGGCVFVCYLSLLYPNTCLFIFSVDTVL